MASCAWRLSQSSGKTTVPRDERSPPLDTAIDARFFLLQDAKEGGDEEERGRGTFRTRLFNYNDFFFLYSTSRCELGRRYVQLKLFKMCDERGRTMNACGVDNCGSQLTGERGCLRALV